ncbi:MAG: hypothetical protein AB2A00_30085 [Myxococcota bacterium]
MCGRPLQRAGLLLPLLLHACTPDDGSLSETVPLVTPSSDTVTLGPIYPGQTASHTVRIRSSGNGAVTVRGARVDGDSTFSVQPLASRTLQPGESLDVAVTYTSPAPGAAEGVLIVDNDSRNAPELRVGLRGETVDTPLCDDGNPCTDDTFDVNADRCITTFNTLPCNDGSACTFDDHCVEGACRGSAVECQPSNPCQRAVCNAATGCVSLDDPTICDDGNPCTSDLCDAQTGCIREPAPDGTGCGGAEGCVSVRLCVSGACEAFPAPDWTPCDDENICTVIDRCVSGACQGTDSTEAPAIVGQAFTWGGPGAAVARVEAGFVVVDGQGTVTAHEVVEDFVETQLIPFDEPLILSNATGVYAGAIAAAPHYVATAMYEPDGTVSTQLFSMNPAVGGNLGRITGLAANAFLPSGDWLYACGTELNVVDVSDLSSPVVVASAPLNAVCRGMVLGTGILVATDDGIKRFNISGPVPVLDATFLPGEDIRDIDTINGMIYVVKPDQQLGQEGNVFGYQESGGDLEEHVHLANYTWISIRTQGQLLAMIHDRGTSGRHSHELHVFDMTTPQSPALVAGVTISLPRSGGTVELNEPFVLVTSEDRSVQVFRLTGQMGPQALQRVADPQHGAMQVAVSQVAHNVVVSSDSARAVALNNVGVPFFLVGGVFDHPADLVAAGEPPVPSFLLVPRAPTGGEPLRIPRRPISLGERWLWVDAHDGTSATIASRDIPSFMNARGDGKRVYLASVDIYASPNVANLAIHDLALEPQTLGVPLQPPQSFSLVVDLSGSDAFPAPDGLGQMTALVVLGDRDGVPASALATFSTADGAPPQLTGTARVDEPVISVLPRGDTVAVLLADRLEIREATGTLDVITSVDLTGAHHILAFDGTTVVMTTSRGVDFVRVTGNMAQVIGSLPVPWHTSSALVQDDRLHLISPTAYTVVSPPCPLQ